MWELVPLPYPSPPRPENLGHVGFFPHPPIQAPTASFSSIFGRTDLIIAASKAKNCGEVDGEVRLPVEAPKLAQKDEKRCPTRKKIVEQNFFRRKLSWRESSETRFGKVSRRKLRENVEKLREHVGVGGMAEPLKFYGYYQW